MTCGDLLSHETILTRANYQHKSPETKATSHVPGQLFTLSMTSREGISAHSHGFRLIFNSQYYYEGMSMPCVKHDTA